MSRVSWLAHLKKHVTLDFRVLSSSPTSGVKITKKKKNLKKI